MLSYAHKYGSDHVNNIRAGERYNLLVRTKSLLKRSLKIKDIKTIKTTEVSNSYSTPRIKLENGKIVQYL